MRDFQDLYVHGVSHFNPSTRYNCIFETVRHLKKRLICTFFCFERSENVTQFVSALLFFSTRFQRTFVIFFYVSQSFSVKKKVQEQYFCILLLFLPFMHGFYKQVSPKPIFNVILDVNRLIVAASIDAKKIIVKIVYI